MATQPEAGINAETDLERAIMSDPEWIAGALWGKPRSGHPEGKVATHILEVLANVDAVALDADERRRLRLVAIIHDSFKYRVDRSAPRVGENHHAMIARRFAEQYLAGDPALLDVIELHDEAYHCWCVGDETGDWDVAEQRAERLIARLGGSLTLFLRFYKADNATGSKSIVNFRWFESLAQRPAA